MESEYGPEVNPLNEALALKAQQAEALIQSLTDAGFLIDQKNALIIGEAMNVYGHYTNKDALVSLEERAHFELREIPVRDLCSSTACTISEVYRNARQNNLRLCSPQDIAGHTSVADRVFVGMPRVSLGKPDQVYIVSLEKTDDETKKLESVLVNDDTPLSMDATWLFFVPKDPTHE